MNCLRGENSTNTIENMISWRKQLMPLNEGTHFTFQAKKVQDLPDDYAHTPKMKEHQDTDIVHGVPLEEASESK